MTEKVKSPLPDMPDLPDVTEGEIVHLKTVQAHIDAVPTLTAEDEAKEQRLLRKVDWHIMPLLMITYGIQYSDKITLSSAVAFDLVKSTGLVGNDFAWLSTGFYLAYLIAEFPMGWTMQRFPIERVLGFTVLGWGICVLGLAACNNFRQLMAVRTILGILEAPISPGFLVMVTAWYRKEEHMIRCLSFFFFSLFILISNYAVGNAAVGSSLQPWRAIHLFLGSMSFLWGCVLVLNLRVPKNAKWLSAEEKSLLHARLVRNQTGESSSGMAFKWEQVRECARDPQIYFIALYTITQCAAAGGFSTFSTIILKSFGLNTEQTILYQMPWYALQFTTVVTLGLLFKYFPQKNLYLVIPIIMSSLALIGICLEALLDNKHLWGRLAGFWITGFAFPGNFIVWSSPGLNVAGRTKKSMVNAITFACFCAGFCIGPQTFYASSAPTYRPGLYFCVACFCFTELILGTWFVWVRWENRRRDNKAAASHVTPEQQALEGAYFGMQDMTDIQNPHFRYRY